MTIENILNNSKYLTDETISDENAINSINRCISLINTKCNTKFPYLTNLTSTYTYIPNKWLVSLLSPYLCYSIKMNDTSTNEANNYLDTFYNSLNEFKDKIATLVDNYENGDTESGISNEYIDYNGFGGVYKISTENSINVGFFSNSGNGGSF